MNEWKKCITAGNRDFSEHDFDAARLSYEQAKQHAENLLCQWSDPDEAASALVVSYHNLADLHQLQGDFSAAREALKNVHKIVLNALEESVIDSKRYASLLRASVKTYSALSMHRKCFLCRAYH
ncbi:MAG: hypothetical protein JKX81_08745 [Arenicella sp.]|nr:hypothetical protein [Arenicella sp.]